MRHRSIEGVLIINTSGSRGRSNRSRNIASLAANHSSLNRAITGVLSGLITNVLATTLGLCLGFLTKNIHTGLNSSNSKIGLGTHRGDTLSSGTISSRITKGCLSSRRSRIGLTENSITARASSSTSRGRTGNFLWGQTLLSANVKDLLQMLTRVLEITVPAEQIRTLAAINLGLFIINRNTKRAASFTNNSFSLITISSGKVIVVLTLTKGTTFSLTLTRTSIAKIRTTKAKHATNSSCNDSGIHQRNADS